MKTILFAAAQEEERSVVRKLMMGLMLGAAIGWVLLRYRRHNGLEEPWETQPGGEEQEIEITGAVLAEEEAEEALESLAVDQPAASEPTAEPARRDRLEAIKGIGPVFAKRLQAAGITSYQQLAGTSPDRIREIVSAQPWQAVEAEEWIAQAREMS